MSAQHEGAGASRPSAFLPGDMVRFVAHQFGDGVSLIALPSLEVPDAETLEEAYVYRVGKPCLIIQAVELEPTDCGLPHWEFTTLGESLNHGPAYIWDSWFPSWKQWFAVFDEACRLLPTEVKS